MKRHQPPRAVNVDELEAVVERARAALDQKDYETLKAAMETLAFLTRELEKKGVSVKRLQRLLFGPKTEKTKEVLSQTGTAGAETGSAPSAAGDAAAGNEPGRKGKEKLKGHGRNGVADYWGAKRRRVPLEKYKEGQRCPLCPKGKLYSLPPETLIRVVAHPPLDATVTELEKLRCNLCHTIWTAPAPAEVGEEKYDAGAVAMMPLLRYGTGLPSYRLERLQASLGIPLPAATQWEIARDSAGLLVPVHVEFIRQAAQGELFHNDDTTMRILAMMGKRRQKGLASEVPVDRTGTFTTGILSVVNDHRIVLFFTGWKHAGENLAAVLAQRAKELQPPMQMCDALSRNLPKPLETILSNCVAHSRRKYVDVVDSFPDECRYVLEALREVYHNDELARRQSLSVEARLRLHQSDSGPVMERLEGWLREQMDEKKVEPNSGLGQAMGYMRNHWTELTLFLRVPGAPLDNTAVERVLKRAIIHRKNSMFYKTANGARVGDLFMSLIHTAELARANPFDYLTELLRHAKDLADDPGRWMPWNYKANLSPPGGA
jgi:transposase